MFQKLHSISIPHGVILDKVGDPSGVSNHTTLFALKAPHPKH